MLKTLPEHGESPYSKDLVITVSKALDREDVWVQTNLALQIQQALEGRAAFYDLIASWYFLPLTEEQIEVLAHMDWDEYETINTDIEQGIQTIKRALMKRNTATRQQLAIDFTSSFAGVSSWQGRYAVPYESVFTSEEGLLFQEAYHDVYHLYRQTGVRRAEGYDYPDDHLSFMCEYQRILSMRAIQAIDDGDLERACEILEASRDFLNQHICSWFDDFADLANKLIETNFYRGILQITKGFWEFDYQLLDDAIQELS